MELKNKKANRGYSLIELIVVVGLTSILAIAVTAIMLTNMLGSSRVRTLINVRQSGDYAMRQLQHMVRNAKRIKSCNTTSNTLTILNPDGRETAISLTDDRIASSSTNLTPPNTEMKVTGFKIKCLPEDSDPQLIEVSFTISNVTSNLRPFSKASVDFSTSIEPRNP